MKTGESCKQQNSDVESELELQHKLTEEKHHDINNELINDETYKGKGKGGKGYVKKLCNSKEPVDLKQQYLSKIKSEKKYLRFLQLDEDTKLMICKIDGLRGLGIDNNLCNVLLEMFEGKCVELERLKKTVEEMKELEYDHAKDMEELIAQLYENLEKKDQEINCLKKKLQDGKGRRGYCLGESSKIKNEPKSNKHLKIGDLDYEWKMMIANMEVLRESNKAAFDTLLILLEQQKF